MRRLVLLVLLLAGCSSAGNDAPLVPPSKAPGQCSDLVWSICQRRAECTGQRGAVETAASCDAQIEPGTHCERATGVSPTYQACLNELVDYDCNTLLFGDGTLLPESCRGAIKMGSAP